MKYCILIMDGAAGEPIPEHEGKTSLELARTPFLDTLVQNGTIGLSRNVPEGYDPDSAVACMSIFGYDPKKYYGGRAPIEAVSLDIPITPKDILFRCNLVTITDGKMVSHSAGSISTTEAHELVASLNKELANQNIYINPGIAYRNILKLNGYDNTVEAICTPPHDIPGRPVLEYLPSGNGSEILLNLMKKSEAILKDHPVNKKRIAEGKLPATGIWLFWGSGNVPEMPEFVNVYGKKAAVTSGVSLLNGLGKMASMDLIDIPGVTDGPDNDYKAQVEGAIKALDSHDVVIIHIESPDEAGHIGSIKEKIEAIENIDRHVVSRISEWRGEDLRLLVTPDHPTPVLKRTHNSDPVPFLIWGKGINSNNAQRLTEQEAEKSGIIIDPGCTLMGKLLGE